MADVSIVDTSVFCNVLNIPKLNDERGLVMEQLRDFLEKGTHLLLPMAVVYETGNHIAHISEGRLRRQCAQSFVVQVKMAIAGETPWTVMQVPTLDEVQLWLTGFPDSATQGKGMGDLSIVQEWEKSRRLFPNRRVFIWSLDTHLQGYDSHP
ncbi:MAG: hypothetical protein ACRC8Y_21705 [Chroococcales cyanobacterium]